MQQKRIIIPKKANSALGADRTTKTKNEQNAR